MKKLFSTTEVAELCQISRFTASKWVREGKIKGISLGRNYKITADELVQFLKEYNFPIPQALKTVGKDYDRTQKYCWEYHAEGKNTVPHQCDACLIKQAEILNCFIMRIDDYQEKIKCPIECSKCSYFLEKFADHFAIVKAFDDPAVICTNGTILAANQGFFKISGLTNEAGVTSQNFLDYLSDSSKEHFLAYKDRVRENDPLRPGDISVSVMDAKGDRKDVRLSCKRLKNIPNTFLIFFKV